MITQVLVRDGDNPRMPQEDYQQCRHVTLWKNGFDPTVKRGKVQRYICPACREQFVEGARTLLDKRTAIGRDLMRGLSIHAVARRNQVSRDGVRFVLRMIGARRPTLCSCGQPVGHSGRPLRSCAVMLHS